MQIHLVGRSKEMVSHLYEYSDKAQCEILMSKFRNTIPSTHNKLFFLNFIKVTINRNKLPNTLHKEKK